MCAYFIFDLSKNGIPLGNEAGRKMLRNAEVNPGLALVSSVLPSPVAP